MNLKSIDFELMPKRYRANFFNHLTGYKSANLIGTQDSMGNLNLAIFNSVVHLGANPPLIGFILRPLTVERHTYDNLLESKYYTINHIHENIIDEAHHTSAKYDANVSEFEASKLTPQFLEGIPAPFVKESAIKIGLKYINNYLIQENGTRMVVGEVISVSLAETYLQEDGAIDLEAAKTVNITGLDTYNASKILKKLPYARPKDIF